MSLRGPGRDRPARDPKDPIGSFTEPLPAAAEEHRKADLDHLKRLREIRQKKLLRAGLIALLLVALIVFVLQNAQPVEVHVLFFSGQTLLIWVIVACAALGAIIGYLLGRPSKGTHFHGEASEKGRNRPS